METKLTKELINKYFGDWPYSQDVTLANGVFTIIVIQSSPNIKYSIYIDEFEGEEGYEVLAITFCNGEQVLGYSSSDIIKALDEILNVIQMDYTPSEPSILICDCSSREHQIVIEHDKEDNLVYCHIHLVKQGFFRRLKAGLKYIFGYKCRYGHWEEFILNKGHVKQLKEITELLSK